MNCQKLSPLRGLGSAVLLLAIAQGPGCGDDLPDVVLDGGGTSTSTSGTTNPVTSLVTSADDTTAGSMSDGMGSSVGTSSSSDGLAGTGSSEGTTQGVTVTVTATDSSDDATTSNSSTSDATSGGSTSGAMNEMTSGPTGGMTSGATDGVTSAATDFIASTGELGSTTDTGGTTDMGTTSGGTTDGGGSGEEESGDIEEVPDFSGDFLFAVATPLATDLPFQYIANFDFVPSGFGGTVDIELQPLALDTGSSTTPRTFFGPPMVFPGIPVTVNGTFALPVDILNVAAECNPLYFIDAQANNVVFNMQVLDTDDLCGTVTGFLVFPVASPLDGSTVAATRVFDASPAGLPAVFPVACP